MQGSLQIYTIKQAIPWVMDHTLRCLTYMVYWINLKHTVRSNRKEMEKVSVLRTGYKQGRRTVLHESWSVSVPFSLPSTPSSPISPPSFLFMVWLREKELRFGARRLSWRDTGTHMSGQNCKLTSWPRSSYGFYLAEYLCGQNGCNQWVANLRPHKYWVTRIPHVYLMSSDNFSVSSVLLSLSMFSTCVYLFVPNVS